MKKTAYVTYTYLYVFEAQEDESQEDFEARVEKEIARFRYYNGEPNDIEVEYLP